MKVNTLKLSDENFPRVLSHIPAPPQQLYWAGTPPLDWQQRPRVAIVGSRKATASGRLITQQIASRLAKAGVVIISGLAYGIDAAAHQAALTVSGRTVAVLPGSLERIYPAAHFQLAQRILAAGGTLMSEYPAGTEVRNQNFIARNRLVSGLAEVLLITEATARSGTMHTARFALEQGRTVMAVPGDINKPNSEGCNNIIKSGALLVTSVDDVFFALGLDIKKVQANSLVRGTAEEETLYKFIREGMMAQEELAEVAGLDVSTLNQTLTALEIGGHIRPVGGGNWVIS